MLKQAIMTWADKQKLVHLHFKSAAQHRVEALYAYEILGPLASAQVASLGHILTNAPTASVRGIAALALGHIGPDARLAAPALFRAMKDTDEYVRGNAFYASGRILPNPDPTIRILAAGLDDPFPGPRLYAAMALGEYGTNATATVPALLRVLATNNPADWQFRGVACSALKSIDPQAAAKAGVK
jgi:HEAT repeat protein